MSNNYNAKSWWDNIGESSSAEDKGGIKFGSIGSGQSIYKISNLNLKSEPNFFHLMKPNFKVLDIGSGVGSYAISLLLNNINVSACDISRHLIKTAKKHFKLYDLDSSGIFFEWDGYKLPFKDFKFDMVHTNTVLQHVTDENQVQCIFQEVSRVINDNGYFCISELISPKNFMSAKHVRIRTLNDYKRLGKINGLELIENTSDPKIHGSFVYLYMKVFNISHEKKNNEVDSNNDSGDTNYYVNATSGNSLKTIFSKFLQFISNNFLNKLISLLGLEKYFVSQTDMVFVKKVFKGSKNFS